MKPLHLLVTLITTLSLTSLADVRPAKLFSDHMVIQRETQAPVWGWADPGETVTVTGDWGASATTTADAVGKWKLKLQTPAAGGPHAITIQGRNTVGIKNVLVGEVWLCSGQSNMDFSMKMLAKSSKRTEERDKPLADYLKKEMETAQDDLLRQFTVQKRTSPFAAVATVNGDWAASAPETNPEFSATAYFFGRELRQALGVPVGLIECAWGGTRVEPWMPAEAFEDDKTMAAYFESNMSALKGKVAAWDPAQVEAKHQAALKRWQATKKRRKPRKAADPKSSSQVPATLFNGMVSPVLPYALKGAIWYQGESNAGHNTEKYARNFEAMIKGWRARWGQGDFPFYFAQLANFKAPPAEPVEHNGWASVCDQQRRTLSLTNTGMAVLNDIGEPNDIHPHNKMDVGRRLALWALKNDYGLAIPAWSGPLYRSHEVTGNKVIISFDHAGAGLMAGTKSGMDNAQQTEAPLKRFQICGEDREWHWADAEITGPDAITVSHPDVRQPLVVRYAWAQNPEGANLYNKEGLPASIFTTETEIPAREPR